MKYFIFLLFSIRCFAADYAVPAANQGSWLPGAGVGVIGGIEQYQAGGASARTNIIDVTASPYFAAGNATQTTGTVSSGGTSVTVASATGFAVGNYIGGGVSAIETVTITAGASSSSSVYFETGSIEGNLRVTAAAVGGDSASAIATKFRAAINSALSEKMTATGTGADIIITQLRTGAASSSYITDTDSTGVTSSRVTTRAGSIAIDARISAVSGLTLTIDTAASTAMTDGIIHHNDAPSINAAIAAAAANDVIYLPAGTYRCENSISVYQNVNNITIRGDGPELTILDCRASNGISIGQGAFYTGTSHAVSGTKTKGTSTLTVDSTTGLGDGYLVKLMIENETDNTRIQAGAAPTVAWDGTPEVRRPVVKITSITDSTHIVIDPPLLMDFTNYAMRVQTKTGFPSWRVEKVGVEDLTVDGGKGYVVNGVKLYNTSECWVDNVRSIRAANYPVYGDETYRSQLQAGEYGQRSGAGTSNGAGVLWNNCTSGLIVNNILRDVNPLNEENFSSMNNVWAYNVAVELVAVTMDVNHGAHNFLNLYEGNIAPAYHSDGYYGTASHLTFYRNLFHGTNGDLVTPIGYTASQNRGTRNFVNAGNVFGTDGVQSAANSFAGNPNMGNGSGTGNAEPTSGDFWTDWKLTGTVTNKISDTEAVITMDSSAGGLFVGIGAGIYAPNGPFIYWNSDANVRQRTSVTAISGLDVTFGTGGYAVGDVFPANGAVVKIWANQPAFQEYDLDVAASNTMVHNYHADGAGTGSVQNSTADTLPASLAYTGKPSWFGALTWPPINSDSPTFSLEIIPAGYRYVNDAAPAPESGPAVTVSGNATVGGTLSIGN